MAKQKKIRVPQFSEKLLWTIEHLVSQRPALASSGEQITPRQPAEIRSLSALYWRMENDAADAWFPKRENWLEDVRNDKCSPEILAMICDVYPELTPDLIRDTDFEGFQAACAPLVSARDHYIGLGRHFLAERERLAAFAKDYYSDEDELPDWPLLGRRGWLPELPIPISESVSIDRFEPSSSYPDARCLPGLNARYGQIRRLLSPTAKPPFNGDCYRLLSMQLENSGAPIFTYGPCKYFDYYDTCEVHALKIASLERDGKAVVDIDPFDIAGHAAVPGVNTLTVFLNFPRFGQNRFLLHRRSGATVQAGNTLHVVPSGQHQPSQAFYGLDADVSIWRTMVREFCEELFNVAEAHGLGIDAGDPLDAPDCRRIVEPLFRSRASRAYLLGMGLDPVTAKPEILVVNIIDFRKLTQQQRDAFSRQKANWEGQLHYFDLTETQIRTQLELDRSHDLKWLPAGKACLTEFLRHFRWLMEDSQRH
ncbi:MAG TPA: hypothetical protein VF547_04655 [Allosphingosinicella sp.]|jgi:hypothetical protein